MSRGHRAADDPIEASSRTDEPAVPDITAVRRDDDLVAALAGRRIVADTADVAAAADDDAIRLLRALIADVDADAPITAPRSDAKPGRRRRARVFVSLGVATMVLTSTGVAAAGGGLGGVGGAITRFVAPADDRPYRESRAELRRAHEAADRREYESARTSLDKARHRRRVLRGPQANAVDKEIGRLESRLRDEPPPFPRPPGQLTPAPRPPRPGDLQRRARTEAERRLDDIQSRWPSRR